MSKAGVKNRSLYVAGGVHTLTEALAALGALKLRIEETTGSKPGRPEYEVFAPDGWSFQGPHSFIVRDTLDKARMESAQLKQNLQRCEPGCECGWDEETP